MKDRTNAAERDANAGATTLRDFRSAPSQHRFDVGPLEITPHGIVEYRRERPTMPCIHTQLISYIDIGYNRRSLCG